MYTNIKYFIVPRFTPTERERESAQELVAKARAFLQSSHVYDVTLYPFVWIFSFAGCLFSFCCWNICACTINYVSDDLQIDYYPFKSTPMHAFQPLRMHIIYLWCCIFVVCRHLLCFFMLYRIKWRKSEGKIRQILTALHRRLIYNHDHWKIFGIRAAMSIGIWIY